MTSDDALHAHGARLYAGFLSKRGEKDSWPGDMQLAQRIRAQVPNVELIARNQRSFLIRAVRTLVGQYGLRQVLDVGSGLSHEPNVHQVAQEISPDCRVAYVDRDAVISANLAASLHHDDRVAHVTADVRDPDSILGSPEVRRIINFEEPVALLLASVFLFVQDDADPAGIIKRLVAALPSGSYVAFSQGTYDYDDDRRPVYNLTRMYGEGGVIVTPRSKATIAGFLDGAGLEVLEPGIVATNRWRPDDTETGLEADSCIHAALAYKPL
ncbi:SAM-dependent methyltransferase [Streptomyces sp. NA02950]|uniref:SAM-dependent methyltransferase n=1 Tax=Streptomyces sp. NA02950 TaxID=2742137 RepID=UPI001591C990|nr:SAM-dependent methyltransferase [Streptomyces sp. NA02950]QKV90401.1 SAM-dependent methyltransferase [Streptomyces sp. NA02950]QKV97266.1 SAM-dependent methyltransferase [Streptomyces sp. NA02950]